MLGLAVWFAIVAIHAAYRLGQEQKYSLAYQAYEKGQCDGTYDGESRVLKLYLTHGQYGANTPVRPSKPRKHGR